MALPLRKTIFIAVLIAGVVLSSILLLGVHQMRLRARHDALADRAEKVVFQFTIIREHLQDLLLTGQHGKLTGVAAELEELNSNLGRLLAVKEVAAEYRLGLLNGMDLPGTILLVRRLAEGPLTTDGVQELNEEMRALNERLLVFDRLLVSSAKSRLISFQDVVIGTLAVLLSLLVGLLVWLRRRLVVPVAQLGLRAELALREGEIPGPMPRGCQEIDALGGIVTELLWRKDQSELAAARCRHLASAMKRAIVSVATSSGKEPLFRDVCRALLHNPEYCLVWFGEPDPDGAGIQPIMADGSTTMNKKECDSCLAVLLTEAEEKGEGHNPALQAMQNRKAVVARDILADVPLGLLKGTPLAKGEASCLALPVEWQGVLHGVISIYAAANESFSEQETTFLEVLAGALGGALAAIACREKLAASRERVLQLCTELDAVVAVVDGNGRLLSLNAGAVKLAGRPAEEFAGRPWHHFLRPQGGENASQAPPLPAFLEESSRGKAAVPMAIQTREQEQAMPFRVIRMEDDAGAAVYWCVAWPQPSLAGEATAADVYRSSRLALLGEIAIGVAHEISDLSNGMINYAQVLADEAAEGSSQAALLNNIITAGEHVAAKVGKLVFYGETGQPEEYLPLLDVLRDAVALEQYHMRKAGVQVALNLPEEFPALPVNAHQVQQVLLEICNHARRALNLRYPGRHENKRFQIEGQVVAREGGEALRLLFTDHGPGIAPRHLEQMAESEWGAGAEEGLARSREIVGRHGGTMSITSVPGESTTIILEFPVN
ncbi:MAG: GAF domain-containing protein [Thermodesulfobacteriota bacterium]